MRFYIHPSCPTTGTLYYLSSAFTMASARLPLLTALASVGILRRFMQPLDIGVADKDGHRVLEARLTDYFIAERFHLWIDPPIGAGPCYRWAGWSIRPVRFMAEEPVARPFRKDVEAQKNDDQGYVAINL
jgi:hypothetical protein